MPASCVAVEISPVLWATRAARAHGRRQPCRDAAVEGLRRQDADHLAGMLRAAEAPFEDGAQQPHQPVSRDAVRDAGVEGAIVFDAAHEIDAGDAGVGQDAARHRHADEVDAGRSWRGCC